MLRNPLDQKSSAAKLERQKVIKNIGKSGLISSSQIDNALISADAVGNKDISANIIHPALINEHDTVGNIVNFSIKNEACGANAIAIERAFQVTAKNLQEVEYLFNKRLKYNFFIILKPNTIDEDNPFLIDRAFAEGKIRENNRNDIKMIFTPTHLYEQVKTIFNDIEVVSVEFENLSYCPHPKLVASQLKYSGDKKDLLDKIGEQLPEEGRQYFPWAYEELENSDLLGSIQFNLFAPNYRKALKEYIESKKEKEDYQPFATHIVRLENNADIRSKNGEALVRQKAGK